MKRPVIKKNQNIKARNKSRRKRGGERRGGGGCKLREARCGISQRPQKKKRKKERKLDKGTRVFESCLSSARLARRSQRRRRPPAAAAAPLLRPLLRLERMWADWACVSSCWCWCRARNAWNWSGLAGAGRLRLVWVKVCVRWTHCGFVEQSLVA